MTFRFIDLPTCLQQPLDEIAPLLSYSVAQRHLRVGIL